MTIADTIKAAQDADRKADREAEGEKARYEQEQQKAADAAAGEKARVHANERVRIAGINAVKDVLQDLIPAQQAVEIEALKTRVEIIKLLPEEDRAKFLSEELNVGGGLIESLIGLVKEVYIAEAMKPKTVVIEK